MKLYVILCVLALVSITFCGTVSGHDHYLPEEMDDIQYLDGKPFFPVWAFDTGLYFSQDLYGADLNLHFSISEHIPGDISGATGMEISTVMDISGDRELAYISFSSSSEPSPRVLYPEETDYFNIFKLSTEPSKQAQGQLLMVPLVNYPAGTTGQVAPILELDGEYIVPLIQMPRGHLNNHHSETNEWGITYDSLVQLDYQYIHPEQS